MVGSFLKEVLFTPTFYANSIFAGGIINQILFHNPIYSTIPFLIPFCVEVITSTTKQYVKRNDEFLNILSSEMDYPIFITDLNGNIIHSSGETLLLFQHFHVQKLKDLFTQNYLCQILNPEQLLKSTLQQYQVFSFTINKWYQVNVRMREWYSEKILLIWMEDITRQQQLIENEKRLRRFSGEIVTQVRDADQLDSIFEKLASMMIHLGYSEVFIATGDGRGNFLGHIYRRDNHEMIRSEVIRLEQHQHQPVLSSHKAGQVIWADIKDFASPEAFEREHLLHSDVKRLLKGRINNFIDFYENDFSVVGFNKTGLIGEYDHLVIETAVNYTRSLNVFIDLARENDEEFVQKVMGLCAAAEYSDEITGKHIIRVNAYSQFLAEKMGFSKHFVKVIGQVAALHDIGKVAIPDLIKLTRRYEDDERSRMQMHTIYGAQIIETMMQYAHQKDPRLEMAYNIALHHHQTWNGRGYPGLKDRSNRIVHPIEKDYHLYMDLKPLKGDDIPIEALIAGLADSYDALRSKRSYKPEFSHKKAMALLAMDDRLKISGSDRFGPKLWALFEMYNKRFDEIYENMTDH